MKANNVLAAALYAGSAAAAPVEARQSQMANIDPIVLQFALTLEHLENKFYSDALQKFTEADFTAAGAPAKFYRNLKFVAADEQAHVAQLSDGLTAAGLKPNQPCKYKFPYTDAKSFLGLSTILEGVGTSAYLGGAPLITSKDYLTIAGSILVVEAEHTALLRGATHLVPNANPNGTPLSPTSAYTLAAQFITSCPKDNTALPFKPFPAATAAAAASPAKAGGEVTIKAENIPANAFVTFVSGLAVESVSAGNAKKCSQVSVKIPASASGQSYVFVTETNFNGTFTDKGIVAGPAILEVAPVKPTQK